MSKIYNKNAREKALLEEAYTNVYKESAVDVELDHWWDFDEHDVITKVYHGARHSLPPEQGTPEYETNSEKIFTWLQGKYPQVDDDNHEYLAWDESGTQEYDMERDPLGRREADPREW